MGEVENNTQIIPGRWNYRRRDIGTIIWISFLSACAGTFVIFAVLDPEALNEAWVFHEMGRKHTTTWGSFRLCRRPVA
jgi:hypothetical protein